MAIDTHPAQEDAAALEERREALRAFVAEITAIAVNLTPPTTYLEADRAVRALTVADRAVQAFARDFDPEDDEDVDDDPAPTETQTLRQDIRACADRVMQSALLIPKPEIFLEVERAQRYALSAGRLLTQLYVAAPPRSAKQPGSARFPDIDDDMADEDDYPSAYGRPPNGTVEEWRAMFAWKIDGARAKKAMNAGFWNSGQPFDPADPFAECLYPDSRVPDFNPRSRNYEPGGDLKVMQELVSEEIWNAYLQRLNGDSPEDPVPPEPPPQKPPPQEPIPDNGPSIRRL